MRGSTPLAFLLIAFLFGCSAPTPKPQKSALEVREFQTRQFEVKDTRLVMKAVVNVLQDDGFIVRNAVPELGLITASKENAVEESSSGLPSLGFGFGAGYAHWGSGWGSNEGFGFPSQEPQGKRISIVEASVNVTEYGAVNRVRVNFSKKIVDGRGAVTDAQQVEDATVYQSFFSKVDQSLYLQREIGR